MNQTPKKTLPFRPKEHAEDYILSKILSGLYPPESMIPSERALAEEIGVTRPTLRETLHRLAGEGWLIIRHGKPTLVNDYWNKGGLGLLNTMARYGKYLPENVIDHLMSARAAILPGIAFQSASRAPETILDFATQAASLKNMAKAYARFDWDLQKLFARESGNPFSLMLLNSFETLFLSMAQIYFSHSIGKNSSAAYYKALVPAIKEGPGAVEILVRQEMVKAREIWSELKSREHISP